MTDAELVFEMERIWRECASKQQPDCIIASPFAPYKGDWRRFVCRFFGHQWVEFSLLNICHSCERCGSLLVEPMEPIDIGRSTYDWWRKSDDKT